MFAFPKKQCSFIVKIALLQDNPVRNRITLKPEKHWLIWNKNDSDFDKFRNSCAARTSYTREEGSEPAELNGFSSLNVFFAQRCEMCRATDTLSDISPPTQTPQISIFLSKRLVEVGTVRSLIRGGGGGRGGSTCVCGGWWWGGSTAVSGEIWEIPEALVQRRQDLKLLWGLYLYSFLYHLLTDPRDCVNSSAPWDDSKADNETTLCVPVVRARRTEQRGFYKAWGRQRQTRLARVASCVWTTTLEGRKPRCPPGGTILSFPSCLFLVFAGSFAL